MMPTKQERRLVKKAYNILGRNKSMYVHRPSIEYASICGLVHDLLDMVRDTKNPKKMDQGIEYYNQCIEKLKQVDEASKPYLKWEMLEPSGSLGSQYAPGIPECQLGPIVIRASNVPNFAAAKFSYGYLAYYVDPLTWMVGTHPLGGRGVMGIAEQCHP